jgi:hypothetical protein
VEARKEGRNVGRKEEKEGREERRKGRKERRKGGEEGGKRLGKGFGFYFSSTRLQYVRQPRIKLLGYEPCVSVQGAEFPSSLVPGCLFFLPGFKFQQYLLNAYDISAHPRSCYILW